MLASKALRLPLASTSRALLPRQARSQLRRADLRAAIVQQSRPASSDSKDSIFDSNEDAWEQVFKDIEPTTQTLLASHSPNHRRPRRQTMTAREASTFDEMFNAIFEACDIDEKSGELRLPSSGIGRGRNSSKLEDFSISLRQRHRHIQWSSTTDRELDQKKEALDLCETDQTLLEWAMREVFAESQRYEEVARKADAATQSSDGPSHLQPTWYPHLIAQLMKTFRERYCDPNLALAIFDYARHLSIASYVFGCTTAAYNELIETRWRCFRDLRGVCDALEEMRVNGIEMDTRTRAVVEMARRDVGERNLWVEETSVGSGEVWEMLQRMDKLIARDGSKRQRHNTKKTWDKDAEAWQQRALQDDVRDGWEFGQWESGPETSEPSFT